MGPYFVLNAVLIGLYGFSAVYHLVLWWQSRREPVLLAFALHCAFCSALSTALIALASAATPEAGELALDRRVELAAITQVSQVWLLSLITGLRARRYVRFITAVFLTAARDQHDDAAARRHGQQRRTSGDVVGSDLDSTPRVAEFVGRILLR